ncbi:hypothetical protein BvCmsNSNP036_00111 [Escherichia coli]|nr:hypothetical protein BvCmsNSNP036_00111 [Escherichia coli]
MIGSMPGRDRFRCHFAPSEFEPATVVPDKVLDKYDEYLPESLLAKGYGAKAYDIERTSIWLLKHLRWTGYIVRV